MVIVDDDLLISARDLQFAFRVWKVRRPVFFMVLYCDWLMSLISFVQSLSEHQEAACTSDSMQTSCVYVHHL